MILAFNDTSHSLSADEMREAFGGKGANLWVMTNELGLPVPPGFTIGTSECIAYMQYEKLGKASSYMDIIDDLSAGFVKNLEAQMGRKLGDKKAPLLVSVRSGARVSMPGMMDTILNLGLNDETVKGLAAMTNEDFAYDSYRRFLQMYGTTVVGIEKSHFEGIIEVAKRFSAGKLDAELNAILIRKFQEALGDKFPQDVKVQLRNAIEAVFKSWNCDRAIAYRDYEGIDHNWGTAVNIQSMVFGNLNEQSGTGVVFTRDPSTGENKPYGDFLVNAQGEDVVDGSHVTTPIADMRRVFPDQFVELLDTMVRLEDRFKDMCDIEFTIEDGKLWVLQTRTGKRSARASVRIALDMVREGLIDSEVGTDRIMAVAGSISDNSGSEDGFNKLFGSGQAACDGVVTGKIAFSPNAAIRMAAEGETVILVRNQTDPDDMKGIAAASGLLTMFGGLVSHAAVVARGWNKVCVVGASAEGLLINSSHTKLKNKDASIVLVEGDSIKIDGSTGNVYVAG
jgi:pyruvate, orthophosphate dikinase